MLSYRFSLLQVEPQLGSSGYFKAVSQRLRGNIKLENVELWMRGFDTMLCDIFSPRLKALQSTHPKSIAFVGYWKATWILFSPRANCFFCGLSLLRGSPGHKYVVSTSMYMFYFPRVVHQFPTSWQCKVELKERFLRPITSNSGFSFAVCCANCKTGSSVQLGIQKRSISSYLVEEPPWHIHTYRTKDTHVCMFPWGLGFWKAYI